MPIDESLRQYLKQRDEQALDNAYADGKLSNFFAVDWRQDDAHTVEDCAECLELRNLSAQWRDDDLVITYNGLETKAPLRNNSSDRHITICTLNEILAPDFEIRYFVGSHGSDTGGFIVLSAQDWQTLERESSTAVNENFLKLDGLPNIFTELTDSNLPAPARSRVDRMFKGAAGGSQSNFNVPLLWPAVILTVLLVIYLILQYQSR